MNNRNPSPLVSVIAGTTGTTVAIGPTDATSAFYVDYADLSRYCAVNPWLTKLLTVDNEWLIVALSKKAGLFCAVSISGLGNRVMTSP